MGLKVCGPILYILLDVLESAAEKGGEEMESCGRSSLSVIASRTFRLPSSGRLFPSLSLTHLKRKLSLSITSFSSKIHSPLCNSHALSLSLSISLFYLTCNLSELVGVGESDKGNPLPRGAGEGVKEDARSKLLQVVLVSPQVCTLTCYISEPPQVLSALVFIVWFFPSTSWSISGGSKLILSLTDSWEYRLHCKNMCGLSCWAAFSWGKVSPLDQANTDLLVISSAHDLIVICSCFSH